LVLYLRKKKMTKDFMKETFMHIIRNESSTGPFHNLEITEEKFGWYPSGDISQQRIARDHVVFVGDAGCWTTPCGWGMGFILGNYKRFSEAIAGALDRDELDKKSLLKLSLFATHEKYEILLNALAMHFLARASVSQLDRFIKLFSEKIDPLLCEKLFTLTIAEKEVISVMPALLSEFGPCELLKIISKRDYRLIMGLIKYFIKDICNRISKTLGGGQNTRPPQGDSGFDFNDR
jgi:flavin-dependent dehydrogenase